MELVAKAPLKQELLEENDSYILDHGGNKIFVWHGRLSTKEERKSSMIYASVSYAHYVTSPQNIMRSSPGCESRSLDR